MREQIGAWMTRTRTPVRGKPNLGGERWNGTTKKRRKSRIRARWPSVGIVWDNFDISKVTNAGFKLEYVNPETQGDQLIVEIEEEDFVTEIEFWKHAIVCYVLGAHPPFTVLHGFIQRMWGKHGINKVVMMQNGIIMVRFDTAKGKNEIIQGGIYHFDNKPLIVKSWSPDMEFTRDELYSVPIWIKIPGLDFKYWSAKGLSKLGSLVGKPLMVDRNTERKIGLNFARLLVEVQIDTPLPDVVLLKNERGKVIEQRVTYDWKPSICKVCQKYGLIEDICRKNKKNVPEGNEGKVQEATQVVEQAQDEWGNKVSGEDVTEEDLPAGKEVGWRRSYNQGGRGGGWRRPQNGGAWKVQKSNADGRGASSSVVTANATGEANIPVTNTFQPLGREGEVSNKEQAEVGRGSQEAPPENG
ncbi:uncharacterized protein LOC132041991 [Lycium ferocissimum]|uniref:uncharacterized protein LOC132041991 n=1 Tax=Lycium ferocissimum TaxID=112874 RepID=UPI0028153EAD|nr:uncharacterized protein LOC132041991 [Lycium ferocissimum]